MARLISANVSFEEDEWDEALAEVSAAAAVGLTMVGSTLESELAAVGLSCERAVDGNGVRCLHVLADGAADLDMGRVRAVMDALAAFVYRFDQRHPSMMYWLDDRGVLEGWWFERNAMSPCDVALVPKRRKRGR